MKYFPRIRSKNHSLDSLRRANKGLPALAVKSVVRFGSVTPTSEVFPYGSIVPIVEINTVEAVKNSSSKLKMKRLFDKAKISHPAWYTISGEKGFLSQSEDKKVAFKDLPYPLVLKRIFGSKGRGMKFVSTSEALEEAIKEAHSLKHPFYVESYMNYTREYRLHITAKGCFYACRKMLKEGADERWYRNDSNCVWYLESNAAFDRPSNWKKIEAACVKALNEVGLDVGAFDVRVQSSKKAEPEFILIEVNSAPAFGDITESKYKELLPNLIISKANA